MLCFSLRPGPARRSRSNTYGAVMTSVRIRYLANDFQVEEPAWLGNLQNLCRKPTRSDRDVAALSLHFSTHFVTCCVTGDRILLCDLNYWSVRHQVAFRDAIASWSFIKADARNV